MLRAIEQKQTRTAQYGKKEQEKKKDEEQERAAFSLKDTEIKPFYLEEIKNPLFKQ